MVKRPVEWNREKQMTQQTWVFFHDKDYIAEQWEVMTFFIPVVGLIHYLK